MNKLTSIQLYSIQDCPKPFSMIFGGTDINMHTEDNKRLNVMTKVVENAMYVNIKYAR